MNEANKLPPSIEEAYSILNRFYGFDKVGDPDRYMLDYAFKDDAYRMIVLHFHLSIEELVKALLYRQLSKRRTFPKKQNVEFVQKLSFKQSIDWAARLGILTKKGYSALKELNDVRNACAHNWILNTYKMKKVTKAKRKRNYIVSFHGKNLLTPEVMKDEFMPLYGDLYIALWKAYYL